MQPSADSRHQAHGERSSSRQQLLISFESVTTEHTNTFPQPQSRANALTGCTHSHASNPPHAHAHTSPHHMLPISSRSQFPRNHTRLPLHPLISSARVPPSLLIANRLLFDWRARATCWYSTPPHEIASPLYTPVQTQTCSYLPPVTYLPYHTVSYLINIYHNNRLHTVLPTLST